MKHHQTVDALIAQAVAERRCAYGTTRSHRSALCRRAQSLELQRVFPNMYVLPEYWNALQPDEHVRHIARTLHRKYPDWVFAGITAAALHGFEHPWHLHNGTITIATASQGPNTRSSKVNRLFMPKCMEKYASGVPVTSEARTVVDCGLSIDFRFALPIIDSALRKGLSAADILSVCSTMRRDCTPIFRLLHYANPASENGWQSLGRGTIIEGGLMVPELQRNIIDPETGAPRQVDYLWHLPGNRFVAGEYGGHGRYPNTNTNNRQNVRGTIQTEHEQKARPHRTEVDAIIRFNDEDVMKQHPMLNKLRAAGIPDAAYR